MKNKKKKVSTKRPTVKGDAPCRELLAGMPIGPAIIVTEDYVQISKEEFTKVAGILGDSILENMKFRTALEFYADEMNYLTTKGPFDSNDPDSDIVNYMARVYADEGSRAREALK